LSIWDANADQALFFLESSVVDGQRHCWLMLVVSGVFGFRACFIVQFVAPFCFGLLFRCFSDCFLILLGFLWPIAIPFSLCTSF